LDEKMKDAVKITVIATGFREVSRGHQRTAESHHSFTASHDNAMGFSNASYSHMDFPDPVGRETAPTPFPEPFPESMTNPMMEDSSRESRSAMEESSVTAIHSGSEVISLDTMRSAMVANFEQDDLDVPAFLRKRGEVM